MDQAKELSELISEIYDAALDRSLWPNSWASPQGETKKCNVHARTVMMNALAIKEAGACARIAM